jgi:hypothetical protein
MKNTLSKYYLIASILVHILIIFGIEFMINKDALVNKKFVIFGAHSRYTTKAIYKSSTPVPFTGKQLQPLSKKDSSKSGKKTTNKIAKKIRLHKKTVKKEIAKKSKKSKTLKVKANVRKTPMMEMPSPISMIEKQVKTSTSKKKSAKKIYLHKTLQAIMPPPNIEELVPEEKIEEKEIDARQNEAVLDRQTEPLSKEKKVIDLPDEKIPEEIPEEINDNSNDDPIHVGIIDSSDPATSYHQRVLGQEISRLWTPPLGVRKGTECSASITIDKGGLIKSFNFVKRSNIPIYDLSILRLKLAKFTLPKDFNTNKRLLVVFHQ